MSRARLKAQTSMAFMLVITMQLNATTYLVGPARTYKTPRSVAGLVNHGDTVLIDAGTYTDEYCSWTKNNLTLRGVAKYAHLIPPNPIPNRKAIWVIGGQNTTVENIEFSDAAVTESDGANGAGIRQEGATVTIRNCYFHHCQNGILGGGGSSSVVTIENSIFANCGLDPCPSGGCVHNMYIGAVAEFTLKGCFTYSAFVGHTVKSRAYRNNILYNRIMSLQSSTSYEINLPNAGTSYIIGNVIQQGPNSQNSAIIDYGSEGLSGHDTSLYVVNNTIVNDRGSGTFISISSTSRRPTVYNNLFVGNGTICNRQMDSAGNVTTNSPGFVDRANFDYHLTGSSVAINRGADPGSANGFSLKPVFQYVDTASTQSRGVIGGLIDAGAYEYTPASLTERFSIAMPVARGSAARIVFITGGASPMPPKPFEDTYYDILGQRIGFARKGSDRPASGVRALTRTEVRP